MRVSAKSAKPSAQRGSIFRRPAKPAKSTAFRILTETNMNSKSTRNGIGPPQITKFVPFVPIEDAKHLGKGT